VSTTPAEGSESASRRPRTYLDAGSSEPLRPIARETLTAALAEGWADPLRLHSEGRRARLLYDNAREIFAAELDCRPDDVTFPPSGTAAVHVGLYGLLRRRRPRFIHSAVEHSSVLHTANHYGEIGGDHVAVGVDRDGRLDVAALQDELERAWDGPSLVAIQAANLESGALQPVEEIAAACADADAPWFVDAAAIAGRLPMPSGWSVAAASAHKWGGPAGVGVLAVRRGVGWRAATVNDDRLDPRSPGYENIPAILAAAAALQEMSGGAADRAERQRALTDRLRSRIASSITDVELIGPEDGRLPHVVACSFLYVDGEVLVTELDRLGFAAASGSACTASTLEPSHVLAAMGVLTHGNVRISLTVDTTEEELDSFLTALTGVVAATRDRLGPL
jgi:cysteine desulfurase